MDLGESDNESHIQSESEYIEHFIDTNLYSIIHLFEELKDTLSFSPFFLAKLKSTCITDLLIYKISDKNVSPQILDLFTNLYNQELSHSYRILTKFATSRNVYIDYDTWKLFCFNRSDLYELQERSKF